MVTNGCCPQCERVWDQCQCWGEARPQAHDPATCPACTPAAHEHGAWVRIEWETTRDVVAIPGSQPYDRTRVTKLLCGVGECAYMREVNHNG